MKAFNDYQALRRENRYGECDTNFPRGRVKSSEIYYSIPTTERVGVSQGHTQGVGCRT